ncbi:MAG: Fe2+-dependent dioxygenase [Alphaproteobacteria bacterium]|nr:Fe2+-dependent dioxygenase [Alphaproteobacteria bacterium]
MILWIQKLLEPVEVATITAAMASARYRPGKSTAGILARNVKENEELDPGSIDKGALDAIVYAALARNKTFEAAARPKRIVTPLYSRYRPGMTYGGHPDNAMMGPFVDRIRVDLSLTLFLSDPATYDGGELSVDTEYGPKTAKLAAGDAALYPTLYYHEVKPVTRSERLVCVTWIQSLVRDPQRRQMLYDMAVLAEWIHGAAPGSPQFRQYNKIQLNLYRMWADD